MKNNQSITYPWKLLFNEMANSVRAMKKAGSKENPGIREKPMPWSTKT